MELLVLGRPAVAVSRGQTTILGDRQQRLLAGLVLHAGRVVSTDRLIEIVFAGDPPPGATTTIRSYVARLRRTLDKLDRGAGEMIITAASGYRMVVGDDELDAERFVVALAEGRRLLAEGDAVEAAVRLEGALDLWRGEAYEGLADEDWARGEATRLEELRVHAYETLIDARLQCGLAEEVAPELRHLIERYPLRDRFRARLALALHRSGRQAEALRSLDEYRLQLVEVGLEPSAELVTLEGAIAAHDPALRLVAPAGRRLRGYRLGQVVGKGRHAEVYRAVQPGTGREVAVKEIHSDIADDHAFIRRFDSVIQAAFRLEHPHMVPLYDYWREPGGAYLVSRLMHQDLTEVLAGGPMEVGEVVGLVSQVGEALAAAHAAGLTHGDLKATEVLVEDANFYLSDIGLTSALAGLRGSYEPDQRHGYEAPETPAGESGGPGADQYSLAVLTAHALLGTLPFGTRGIASPHERAPSMHAHRRAVPGSVDDVLWKATAWDPADRFPDVMAFVDELTAAFGATRRLRDDAEPLNPYKGLRPFTEADAGAFFGRDRVIDELVASLGDRRPGHFVVLVGASGSGKSSVVRAGLVPRLAAGGLEGSSEWMIATMSPGSDPFLELVNALHRVAAVDLDSILQRPIDERTVARLVAAAFPPSQTVLAVIDQLEEVFTLVAEEDTRRAFLTGLAMAIDGSEVDLRVVATLRADYFDRPLGYGDFGRLVKQGTLALVGMAASELEAAITEPVARVGVEVEPALASQIVADVVDRPASLPLLQATLSELFDHRHGGLLTLDAYRKLGGIEAAVARPAEAVYAELRGEEQTLARRMLLRLVAIDATGAPAGRRVLRSELTALSANPDDALRVIDRFAAARLLTFDHHPVTRHPTVEVAHEALIRHWPRFDRWVEEAGVGLAVQRHLTDAARAWAEDRREPGELYRGMRLETALEWVADDPGSLNPLEQEFIDASVELRENEARAERAHLAEQRRTNRRLRLLLGTVGVALAIALMAGFLALAQRDRARVEATVAEVRELAAASAANLATDPELSILLALEAVGRSGGNVLAEAEQALHDAVLATRVIGRIVHGGGNGIAAFSPDGARLLTMGANNRTAEIWQVDPLQRLVTLGVRTDLINDGVFNPAGDLVAVTATNEVWVSDSHSGELRQVLRVGPRVQLLIPVFSSDGSMVAASDSDSRVWVWDMETGEVLRQLVVPDRVAEPLNLAFSPDDRLLAVTYFVAPGTDPMAGLWDVTTGELVTSLVGHEADVVDVAFTPDGSRVVTVSVDATSKVWDVGSGELLGTYFGTEGALRDVSVSSDGRRAASAGNVDVVVWDLDTFETVARLPGHAGGVDGLDFSPDGSLLATSSWVDGTTRLWDLTPGWSHELASFPGPLVVTRSAVIHLLRATGGVMFSPDGSTLIAPHDSDRLAFWDLATGRQLGRTEGPEVIRSLSSTADGTSLALGGAGGIRVVEAASRRLVEQLASAVEVNDVAFHPDGSIVLAATEEGLRGYRVGGGDPVQLVNGQFDAVAISPDGALFAAADRRFIPVAKVYRLDDAEYVGSLDVELTVGGVHRQPVMALAYNQDGSLLATGSVDTAAAVWDSETLDLIRRLEGHAGVVWAVAFDPVRPELATASDDGTVRIWHIESGTARLVLRSQGKFYDTAYSPDGRYLAAVSSDGAVSVFVIDIGELVDVALSRLTRWWTEAECVQYLRTGNCPAPPAGLEFPSPPASPRPVRETVPDESGSGVAADTPPTGEPVTIVRRERLHEMPSNGTFEVTEGAEFLGCAAGTFVDSVEPIALHSVHTCEAGTRTGTFTARIRFIDVSGIGPGDFNAPWSIVGATGDFAGLAGGGHSWQVIDQDGAGGTSWVIGAVRFDG